MEMILDIYKKVSKDASKEQIIDNMIASLAKKVKKDCPEEYKKIFLMMHNEIYDGHFCECLAKKAVSEMENADGTHGGHWTKEQTMSVMNQYNVKADINDWHYVMNMMYSDYCKIIGEDIGMYAHLADAYINDIDAPKDKAFRIYLATHDID